MRKIIRGRNDDASGLVGSVEEIMQRREKLRFSRAEAEVDHPIALFDSIFETGKKRLTIAQSRGSEYLDAVKLGIAGDIRNNSRTSGSMSCRITRFGWVEYDSLIINTGLDGLNDTPVKIRMGAVNTAIDDRDAYTSAGRRSPTIVQLKIVHDLRIRIRFETDNGCHTLEAQITNFSLAIRETHD